MKNALALLYSLAWYFPVSVAAGSVMRATDFYPSFGAGPFAYQLAAAAVGSAIAALAAALGALTYRLAHGAAPAIWVGALCSAGYVLRNWYALVDVFDYGIPVISSALAAFVGFAIAASLARVRSVAPPAASAPRSAAGPQAVAPISWGARLGVDFFLAAAVAGSAFALYMAIFCGMVGSPGQVTRACHLAMPIASFAPVVAALALIGIAVDVFWPWLSKKAKAWILAVAIFVPAVVYGLIAVETVIQS